MVYNVGGHIAVLTAMVFIVGTFFVFICFWLSRYKSLHFFEKIGTIIGIIIGILAVMVSVLLLIDWS
jgi:uncharacterized membrane protein